MGSLARQASSRDKPRTKRITNSSVNSVSFEDELQGTISSSNFNPSQHAHDSGLQSKHLAKAASVDSKSAEAPTLAKLSAPTSQYEYTLLQPGQIRLFELGRTNGRDKSLRRTNIQVKLRHVALTEVEGRFTALSYCWGDFRADRVQILAKGECVDDQPRLLSVTKNLEDFLDRLLSLCSPQRDSISQLVWADGICIDQGAKAGPLFHERSSQVQIMGKIYRAAKNVCVDLGPWDQYAAIAIPFMDEMRQAVTLANQSGHRGQLQEPQFAKYGLPPRNDPKWTAWVKFTARPWFRRLWVLQEYSLAHTGIMLCGLQQMEWGSLPKLMAIMFDSGLHPSFHRSFRGLTDEEIENSKKAILAILAMGVWREWVQENKYPTLFRALTSTMTFEMTDDRDKIYGLLGICSGIDPENPDTQVDYQQSNIDIFRRFTQWMLQTDPKAIRILFYCGDGDRHGALPTWTPFWAGNNWNGGAPLAMMDEECGYNAGGTIKPTPTTHPSLSFTPDNKNLIIQGIFTDTIRHLGPQSGSSTTDANMFTWERNTKIFVIGTITSRASLARRYKPTGEHQNHTTVEQNLMQIYIRTIAGDSLPHKRKHGMIADSTWTAMYDKWELKREQITTSTMHADVKHVSIFDFSKRIITMNAGRRLCITDSGRLAICPHHTSVGDVVCVVLGGALPLILTPTQASRGASSGGDYKLRGAAYVHGLMAGEALHMSGSHVESVTIV